MQVRGRRDGLVVRSVGDELVVFDERTNQAHLLNASLSIVWQACRDGADDREIGARLAAALGTDEAVDDLVAAALADLSRAGLLEVPATLAGPGGMTRRSLLKKAGIAALALPAITTILAPPVAAQTSSPPCIGGIGACSVGGDPCCNGIACTGGRCCNAALGAACDGVTTVCCEGACTSSFCCHPIGGGTCQPGQHDQCCGTAVCNRAGACVACLAAGETPPNGDATHCCSGQIAASGKCKGV